MKIGDTELAILGYLSRDAQTKRNRIAAELGISEASVSKKISNMVASGVIRRFTVELDYQQLGISVHGISLISLEHQTEEKLEEVSRLLDSLRPATEYSTLLGNHDFFVRWMCRDNAHLLQTLKSVLSIDGVQVETLTFGDRHFRQANLFEHLLPK